MAAHRTDRKRGTGRLQPQQYDLVAKQGPLSEDEARQRVKAYEQAVIAYETMDREVDQLLQKAGGHTKDLSDALYARYRELADQRDLAYNQMKALEEGLLSDS
jgi:hypothetical protein